MIPPAIQKRPSLRALLMWIPAVAVLFLCACSLEKHLQEKKQDLLEQYKNLPTYDQLPERTISWQQAVHMMLEGNTEYQQAQQAVEHAKREAGQIWRDLLPSINIGYYYSRNLFQSQQNWGGNNGDISTNVMFMLPELTRIPVDHYVRALAVKKAETNLIIKRRELEARLYQFFREEEIAQKEIQDATGRKTDDNQKKEEEKKLALKDRERWAKLNLLLGNDSARWKLLPGDLPHISPEDYRGRIHQPSEENQLMLTMEIESSRLRRLGIIIHYWPTVQTNFYSPTLFDSTAGTLTGFMDNAKDTRISLHVYLPLDVRGDKANSYRNAETEHRIVLNQARQKMREHKEKAALLLQSWDQYRDWQKATEAYIGFRQQQGASHPDDVRKLHDESLQLQQEMREQERRNVERECALLQEYGLPR